MKRIISTVEKAIRDDGWRPVGPPRSSYDDEYWVKEESGRMLCAI